jgi:hypothetical protein
MVPKLNLKKFCKNFMEKELEEIKFYRFKNEKNISPFAPSWDYLILEAFMSDINIKKLTKFLLEKEKIILNTPIESDLIVDGNTGLGKNSVTSRYRIYNLLDFENEEILKIENNIKTIHKIYLTNLNIPLPNELYAQCWFNVMRKNEQIKQHKHSANTFSYLSGHITVQSEKTYTHYINSHLDKTFKYYDFQLENRPGNITLFNETMTHYTDMHLGNSERITIAFDLSFFPRTKNWKKLYGN